MPYPPLSLSFAVLSRTSGPPSSDSGWTPMSWLLSAKADAVESSRANSFKTGINMKPLEATGQTFRGDHVYTFYQLPVFRQSRAISSRARQQSCARIGKIVGPDSDAELVKPELLVGCRLDRRFDRAAPCIASARLVDQIGCRKS